MKAHQLLVDLALTLLTGSLVSAVSAGTAFTYQGQLTDSALPANGSYDLKFTPYASASGTNAVARPITNSLVAAVNGLFTTRLDFGPGVFTGDARWLEIGVRTNGSPGAFTLVSPRQPLTATPYALQAIEDGANARPGYTGGYLGSTIITNGTFNELGRVTSKAALIHVAVSEGNEVRLEATMHLPGGDETWPITITKRPRPGVPPARIAYDVTVQVVRGAGTNEFVVAPDQPVALSHFADPEADVSMEANLVNDHLLRLLLKPVDSITMTIIRTESTGIIFQAYIEPYRAADRLAQLTVKIMNDGPSRANYIVAVTDCGPTIAPVEAQSVTLDPIPYQLHTLTFELRTSATFSDQNQCRVWLQAETGRVYHIEVVTFPTPTGGGAD